MGCFPAPEFPQLVAVLAEIDTLDADTAANDVADRVGAPEARAAQITALCDATVAPTAACAAAFDYLLVTLQAEVPRLGRFAASVLSGRLQYRQTTRVETGSPDGIGEMTQR